MTSMTTMTRAQAEAVLGALTVRDFQSMEVRTGIAWNGTLCLEGNPVMRVDQAGNGGCNRYDPPKGAPFDEAYVTAKKRLEEAASVVIGKQSEALDSITACLEPGMTGMDAAGIWTEYSTEN